MAMMSASTKGAAKVLQRTIGDAETLGGPLQATLLVLDGDRDRELLGGASDIAQTDAASDRTSDSLRERAGSPVERGSPRALVVRQVSNRDRAVPDVALTHARHELLQLAHVARILARHQMLAHGVVERGRAAQRRTDEVANERQDVLGSRT